MNKRNDWEDFKNILEKYNITKLYHFTDRDNLENIIKNGGLYSWKDCEERSIKESRILYPIQIGMIARVLRPDEPNLPIQIDNQLRNYR